MNSYERKQAYKAMKLQEALKNPKFKEMYEHNKREAEYQARLEEGLKNYGKPLNQEEKPKQRTADEMRMESILKRY